MARETKAILIRPETRDFGMEDAQRVAKGLMIEVRRLDNGFYRFDGHPSVRLEDVANACNERERHNEWDREEAASLAADLYFDC